MSDSVITLEKLFKNISFRSCKSVNSIFLNVSIVLYRYMGISQFFSALATLKFFFSWYPPKNNFFRFSEVIFELGNSRPSPVLLGTPLFLAIYGIIWRNLAHFFRIDYLTSNVCISGNIGPISKNWIANWSLDHILSVKSTRRLRQSAVIQQ